MVQHYCHGFTQGPIKEVGQKGHGPTISTFSKFKRIMALWHRWVGQASLNDPWISPWRCCGDGNTTAIMLGHRSAVGFIRGC